ISNSRVAREGETRRGDAEGASRSGVVMGRLRGGRHGIDQYMGKTPGRGQATETPHRRKYQGVATLDATQLMPQATALKFFLYADRPGFHDHQTRVIEFGQLLDTDQVEAPGVGFFRPGIG